MLRILHLSDLHLDNSSKTHVSIIRQRFYSLVDTIKKTGIIPNIIVVSGDIINCGNSSAFDFFESLIDYALNNFSLKRDDVIISTGNHDLNYNNTNLLKKIEHYPNGTCNLIDEFCFEKIDNDSPLLYPFREYIDFCRRFYNCSESIKDIELLTYCKKICNANFIVINSCWAERSSEPAQKACIACNQLKYLLNEKLTFKENEINIAVLHHPHSKVCEGCTYYYNTETVIKRLYKVTDLVLCGDIHATCKPNQKIKNGAHECIVGNGKIDDLTTFVIYCIDNIGQNMDVYEFKLIENNWQVTLDQENYRLRPKFFNLSDNEKLKESFLVNFKIYRGIKKIKKAEKMSLEYFFFKLYDAIINVDDDNYDIKALESYDAINDSVIVKTQ